VKHQVADTVRPDFVKGSSFVDRLKTSILRTCVLNLIAQIALGTPTAAHTQRKFSSHPVGFANRDCSEGLPRLQ